MSTTTTAAPPRPFHRWRSNELLGHVPHSLDRCLACHAWRDSEAAEGGCPSATARVTLDLTAEQIASLVDVLDSGQQAIGDTTDRMEGEEYGYYDDGDRATQRAFREAADAVVAVAISALDAARKAAGL